MKVSKDLFFSGAMSLGDAIVCSPIVNRFAHNTNLLILPSQRKFYDTLKCLYQDTPNIVVKEFDGPGFEQAYIDQNNLTRIESPDIQATQVFIPNLNRYVPAMVNWDRQIYEFYDIPYSVRYREFKFPKQVLGSGALYDKLVGGKEDYVLFHQQTGAHPNGMGINLAGFREANGMPPYKIVEIDDSITSNMCQYIELIENAKEIHTVNTSFFWLVDSLFNRTNAQLFYHDCRADSVAQINSRWNNNRWIRVHHPEKV